MKHVSIHAVRRISAGTVLAVLSACGGALRPAATPATASAEPLAAATFARVLAERTIPARPQRIAFTWELDEAGARFRGAGVARVAPPDRIRLDLFGPRGETYLAAALVGDSLRMPAAVAGRIELPPPMLLWSALGMLRLPAGAAPLSVSVTGADTLLRVRLDADAVADFRVAGGELRAARRLVSGGVRESVERSRSGGSVRAVYRDWVAYRTLTLTLTSASEVDAFPGDTWNSPGS